jgi:hypothetical protein
LRSSFSIVVLPILTLPAPPFAQDPHDAGRVLLERRPSNHRLASCEVLYRVADYALEVVVSLPLRPFVRPALGIPRSLEDLEDSHLVLTTGTQQKA